MSITPDKFSYEKQSDRYKCPEGKTLSYRYTTKKKKDGLNIRVYRSDGCDGCRVRELCTTAKGGRQVTRWEHQDVLDKIKRRLVDEPQVFRRRKAIIEHIFGTIKKSWGYEQLLLRGLKKIASEAALMNVSYNIRRVITILGTEEIITHLQTG